MVLPRGSESWRKLSRFRRQTQVKPMAAEVLEPRCLMTDPTGTLAVADAAPLTGDVVIGPDLWDDAGLTLQQVGDRLHVFLAGTQLDMIPPLSVEEAAGVFLIEQTRESFDWIYSLANSARPPYDGVVGLLQMVGFTQTLDTGANLDLIILKRSSFDFDEWLDYLISPGSALTSDDDNTDEPSSSATNPSTNPATAMVESPDDTSVIPNDSGEVFDTSLPGDVLLIDQKNTTVGIEDREWAEFDTASSDSAFGELIDYESEGGGDSAASDDINSADIGEGLELDAVLGDELVASLAEPLLSDERF